MFFIYGLTKWLNFIHRINSPLVIFKFHACRAFSQPFMFFIDIVTFKLFKIFFWINDNSYYARVINVFNCKIAKFFLRYLFLTLNRSKNSWDVSNLFRILLLIITSNNTLQNCSFGTVQEGLLMEMKKLQMLSVFVKREYGKIDSIMYFS